MMKRQRGRGRKPGQQQNPNRAYESVGPDIKVRGSAQTVFEKYQQLARDATSSGDRVLAENYLQHAEHYFRVLRAIQPSFVPRSELMIAGYEDDFDDEDGDGAEQGDMDGPDGEAQGRDQTGYNQNGQGQNGQNGQSFNRNGRNQRDNRDNREFRNPREPRDYREPREPRPPREGFEARPPREPRSDQRGEQRHEPREGFEPRGDIVRVEGGRPDANRPEGDDEDRFGRRRRRRRDRFGREEGFGGEEQTGSADGGEAHADPAPRSLGDAHPPASFEEPAVPMQASEIGEPAVPRERRPRPPRAPRAPKPAASGDSFGGDVPAFLAAPVASVEVAGD